MKYYTVHHHTLYKYESEVSESVMEVRMQPRTDSRQRCLDFELEIWPHAQVLTTEDCSKNVIHYFDIPRSHSELLLRARSLVLVQGADPSPQSLEPAEWEDLGEAAASGRYWEWLAPSHFAQPTELLLGFAQEIGLSREGDPLSLLHRLNERVHAAFAYMPKSTAVDSPIDIALESRRGVCQDISHVMIALLRRVGIPARYVSGYIVQDPEKKKEQELASASHAWVEAFLPSTGWVGLDPTNSSLVSVNHIRIAVGRDYADVPPTRGVYKGDASSELTFGVHIAETEDEAIPEDLLSNGHWTPRERSQEHGAGVQMRELKRQRSQQQQ